VSKGLLIWIHVIQSEYIIPVPASLLADSRQVI